LKNNTLNIGFEALSLFGHSGIESYTRSLIRGFDSLDENVCINIFTSYGRAKRFEQYFGKSEKFAFHNAFPHPVMLGNLSKAPIAKLRKGYFLKKNAAKVDLFHFENPCYFNDIIENSVTTIHDIFPFYEDEWAYDTFKDNKEDFKKRYLKAFKSAKMLFVPTNTVKDEILKRFPYVSPDKIQVTYLASANEFVKLTPDEKILKQYGISSKDKFLMFVGRLDKRKNFDRILHALSEVPKKLRSDYKFLVFGGGCWEDILYLERLINLFGLSGTAIHLKNVPNEHLAHFYNTAQGLIFTSFAEGFGLPMVEAMNCGCPVITSNTSCMTEIGADAVLYADPYKYLSIRDAIARLIEDDSLKDELSRKGLIRAADFSWEKAAKDTLDGYRKAMEH